MCGLNLLSWFAMPMNRRSSEREFGFFISKIADVFCGSAEIPFLSIMQSAPSMDTLIITTEQDYNKALGSHVTKRGYTEVLAKPTKYSISPITSNNHCMALMQGFFSLCHTYQ